jgi:hypothetical protein
MIPFSHSMIHVELEIIDLLMEGILIYHSDANGHLNGKLVSGMT